MLQILAKSFSNVANSVMMSKKLTSTYLIGFLIFELTFFTLTLVFEYVIDLSSIKRVIFILLLLSMLQIWKYRRLFKNLFYKEV